jgi:tetratricopeptide (TPR) repeat protein
MRTIAAAVRAVGLRRALNYHLPGRPSDATSPEADMKLMVAALIVVAGLADAPAQGPRPAAENALIDKANAALTARQWQDAENLLKQLIAMAPARWEYHSGLGDAQGNQGRYQEAVASYDKGIALAEKDQGGADAAKAKAGLAAMLTAKGNMQIKLKNFPAAIAAFERAAPLSANPGVAYFNICATLYNMGQTKGVVAACDKAIAADPNKADAYFIKGSVLVAEGTMDKSGKIVVAPACLQALRKYLALAPNGGHAADVKEMLAAIAGGAAAPKK